MKHTLTGILGVLAALVVIVAGAADADKPDITDTPDIKVETVFSKFNRPCSIAIQPSTGSIFVSENGAGQIVRLLPTQLEKSVVAIAGFPKEDSIKTPLPHVGPMGLAFLHQNLIVVGSSDLANEKDAIRVFELPSDVAGKKALQLKDAKQSLGSVVASKDSSTIQGNYWGLAMSPSTLWITSHGDRENAWVLKADVVGNRLENLKPVIATKLAIPVDDPLGIAVRNSRDFVVVSQAGKFDSSRDSMLAFYHTRNGTLMMSLATSLYDIVALAYSPKSNRLYAVDMASAAPKEGGLYRLDSAIIDGRVGVRAVKLTSLDRPTALAFASDNTLYVTAMGAKDRSAKEGDKKSASGVLVKVTGDL